MALSVLDADRGEAEAGLYYGGRHRLLGDLGVMPTATSLRHLSGHVATLEQLGLVKRMNRARSGEQAVYKLTFPVDKSRP
jgi:hypothetical protein